MPIGEQALPIFSQFANELAQGAAEAGGDMGKMAQSFGDALGNMVIKPTPAVYCRLLSSQFLSASLTWLIASFALSPPFWNFPTFDFDVAESTRAATQLMQKFGLSSDEAYNLIAQGAQNGLNKNGDLLDVINEYSNQYSQAGLLVCKLAENR